MKLSIGIVGLPNVGKSTLFKALTKNDITIANYPFATINPNIGVVAVPDKRLDELTALSDSEKKIPAIVEFYDIAGLVKGANQGEGLGNKFLSHIREVQAIIMVLRCFQNDKIIHVDGSVDPMRDMEIINTELILKDLETLTKRIGNAEKEARAGDKNIQAELVELRTLRTGLKEGKLARQIIKTPSHSKKLNLLTAKKQIFLLNGISADIPEGLTQKIKEYGADYVVMDLSKDVADLGTLIKKAYTILDLISFFTTGRKETRAWTARRGVKAPAAAGVIHTDFQNKFIRAEVIYWEELIVAGGWRNARARGKIRTEGKEYTVLDGDVIVVHHS